MRGAKPTPRNSGAPIFFLVFYFFRIFPVGGNWTRLTAEFSTSDIARGGQQRRSGAPLTENRGTELNRRRQTFQCGAARSTIGGGKALSSSAIALLNPEEGLRGRPPVASSIRGVPIGGRCE